MNEPADQAVLITHLEKYLGRIARGWNAFPDGRARPFQIIELEGGMVDYARPFATLGLSSHVVAGGGGVPIHQELLFLSSPKTERDRIPSLLTDVADEVLARGKAMLRGAVMGPRGPIFDAYPRWTALYVAMPVYLPKDFLPAPHPSGCDVFVPWLIPISTAEAGLVKRDGKDAFEAALERLQPDLVDPERAEIT